MRPSTPVLLLIVTLFALPSAGETFDINRSGRKIQLDGFLMDWMEKNRQSWSGSTLWSWDAVNTADGIAGYFHAGGAPACSSWNFKVDAGRHGHCEMVASSAKDTETAVYCVNRAPQQGNLQSITVEWLLQWDSVTVDSNGDYAINIVGNSACGDLLESMLFTGKKPSKTGLLPKNFTLKLIAIILLFIVFFGMQIRIRKKTRGKGSPRQSA